MGTCQTCFINKENVNLEIEVEKARHNNLSSTIRRKEEKIFGSERKVTESGTFSRDFVEDLFTMINVVRNNPVHFEKYLENFKLNNIEQIGKDYYVEFSDENIKLSKGLKTLDGNIKKFRGLKPIQKLKNSIKLKIDIYDSLKGKSPFEYYIDEYNKIKSTYDYEKLEFFYSDNFGSSADYFLFLCFCDDNFPQAKLVNLILNSNFNQISLNMYKSSFLFLVFGEEKEDDF